MDIILGVDSIKYPLSGIGAYSLNLCKEYLDRENINVTGLSPAGLLDPQMLREHINRASKAPAIGSVVSNNKFANRAYNHIRDSQIIKRFYRSIAGLSASRHLSRVPAGSVYHIPNFIGFGDAAINRIVTVHDLSHLDCEGMHPKSRVSFMKRELHQSLAKAQKIIVDSDFTKHRLLASGLISTARENDIHRVYLGVDERYSKGSGENSTVLTKFQLLQKKFFFSLGTIEPRKNHKRLVEAYLNLPAEVAREYPLVICGAYGWAYESLVDLIKGVNEPYRIVLTGHLSQTAVVDLMSAAKIFIYPSVYEGFGMPLLEAMSARVPVITSAIGATMEVAGDAAILVDPHSVLEISEAIQRIVDSSSYENEFVAKGADRVLEFSWKKCADNTIGVYEVALG